MSEPLLPATASDASAEAAHIGACENCDAALQGHYCHRCGQSAHSPVRNFAHAVEEVFESFWHLDGRIFRTLRDLWFPGRVARNYLAGHRVRYIAPLRLFVILSLLTFFVGKLVLHIDPLNVRADGFRNEEMSEARTEAQVEAIESRLLAELDAAERKASDTPGVVPALVATRVQIQGAAASRIAALREARKSATRAPPSAGDGDARPDTVAKDRAGTPAAAGALGVDAADATGTDPRTAAQPGGARVFTGEGTDAFVCRFNDTPFDPATNPIDSPLLPAFADRWLNARVAKGCLNAKRMRTDADSIFHAMLGAVPTALFLLMPVFALMLKLLYLGSGRGYLEHLVVALYSHAFLLLMLMALFVLGTVEDAAPAWLRTGAGLLTAAVWIAMPLYLLLMQKRVYGGGWPSTLVRYCVIGIAYLVLVGFAAAYAALAGISS